MHKLLPEHSSPFRAWPCPTYLPSSPARTLFPFPLLHSTGPFLMHLTGSLRWGLLLQEGLPAQSFELQGPGLPLYGPLLSLGQGWGPLLAQFLLFGSLQGKPPVTLSCLNPRARPREASPRNAWGGSGYPCPSLHTWKPGPHF